MKVKCIQSIAIRELEQTFFQDEEYNIPVKIVNEHPAFFEKIASITTDIEEVEEVEEIE
tara:strand:+ start:1145 stop:1321 length:177 start_codon:yes stop_codon:yes gene_type:complete